MTEQKPREFFICCSPIGLEYAECFVSNRDPKKMSDDDDFMGCKDRKYFHVVERKAVDELLDALENEATDNIEIKELLRKWGR